MGLSAESIEDAAEAVAGVLVLPLLAAYNLRLVGFDAAGQALSLVPGRLGIFLRRAWYARTLEHCGCRFTIQFGSTINDQKTRIGDNCFIGFHCRVGSADIGDDLIAADYVSILSGMRHYGIKRGAPMRTQPGRHARVTIGADVWLGASAVVGADVAAHTIVGSGAVVTKPAEPYEILAGVPARVIGSRPS